MCAMWHHLVFLLSLLFMRVVYPVSFTGNTTATTSCSFSYNISLLPHAASTGGLYLVTGAVAGIYRRSITSDHLVEPAMLCARKSKAFISITSRRSKLALDLSRYHNLSSGHTFFNGSGIFRTVYNVSSYQVKLYIGEPGSIACGTGSLAPVSHEFTVDSSTAGATAAEPDLPECNSTSQITTSGSWVSTVDHDNQALPVSSDASGREWRWRPNYCSSASERADYSQRSELARFLDVARARNLTDLVLVGTSRVRTLYYDLIDMLDPSALASSTAEKAHHHMQHVFPQHARLRVMYHHFECGAKRGVYRFDGYREAWNGLLTDFRSNGICKFNNGSDGTQAVIFSTGVCEAQTFDTASFRMSYPSLLRSLAAPCSTPSTSFFAKSEETVDPNIGFVDALDANRQAVHSTLRNASDDRAPQLLDVYPISRSWKICNDSLDGIHLYSSRGQYTGNLVSKAIVMLILGTVVERLDGVAARPRHWQSTELPPPAPVTFEDGLNGRAIASNKDRRTHGQIFFVWAGRKHPLPDWDTLVALKVHAGEIVYVSDEAFRNIPNGDAIRSVNTL